MSSVCDGSWNILELGYRNLDEGPKQWVEKKEKMRERKIGSFD